MIPAQFLQTARRVRPEDRCSHCGTELHEDLNGVRHCAHCRKYARTDDERRLSRRTQSGVIFGHLQDES